jgi:hypothetical protein
MLVAVERLKQQANEMQSQAGYWQEQAHMLAKTGVGADDPVLVACSTNARKLLLQALELESRAQLMIRLGEAAGQKGLDLDDFDEDE